MEDSTLKLGLLMESAQAHQKLAETHLDKLRAHTQGLDGVVREEIRRTLTDELQELTVEIRSATEALGRMKRAANVRALAGSLLVAAATTTVPLAIARFALPSASDIENLKSRRDQLQASIDGLDRMGARADWRRCGSEARLCIRIDKSAAAYGEKADYYVIEGY